jgi:hypothetical protein
MSEVSAVAVKADASGRLDLYEVEELPPAPSEAGSSSCRGLAQPAQGAPRAGGRGRPPAGLRPGKDYRESRRGRVRARRRRPSDRALSIRRLA